MHEHAVGLRELCGECVGRTAGQGFGVDADHVRATFDDGAVRQERHLLQADERSTVVHRQPDASRQRGPVLSGIVDPLLLHESDTQGRTSGRRDSRRRVGDTVGHHELEALAQRLLGRVATGRRRHAAITC